jgi:hypothetical protein
MRKTNKYGDIPKWNIKKTVVLRHTRVASRRLEYGVQCAMALSNLVMFNAQEYVNVIMDRELFDIWAIGMEELGHIIIMGDGARYYQGVATTRRKPYQRDGWQSWGPNLARKLSRFKSTGESLALAN